jgi:uncharacterized membrane protein YdbT with pleckstrin-like domain
MSYVNDNLMPNEKVLFSAKVHPAIFLPAVISVLLCLAVGLFAFNLEVQPGPVGSSLSVSSLFSGMAFLIAGLLFIYSIVLGLQAIIVISTTEFAVTNRRVIAKTGFIRRHALEMLLTKIESVAVNQSSLGRLLNFGVVTVTGTGGTKESFRAIGQPFVVRKKINQTIEQYAQGYAQTQ